MPAVSAVQASSVQGRTQRAQAASTLPSIRAIGAVGPGSPAERTGATPGETLIAIGGTDLETRFPRTKMAWQRLVEVTSIAPCKLIGIDRKATADFTIVDPQVAWTVEVDEFESKSKNSAFIGWELNGRAVDVYTEGYATMENGKVTF